MRWSVLFRRTNLRQAILCFACCIPAPCLAVTRWIPEANEERAIWDGGVDARVVDARARATETSLLGLFRDYAVDVEYLDANHGEHEKTFKITRLVTRLDESEPARIRIDPAHPERAALSYRMEASAFQRWWAPVGLVAFQVFMIGQGLFFVREEMRRRRLLARYDELP